MNNSSDPGVYPPPLPIDLKGTLWDLVMAEILRQVNNFLQKDLPKLARDKEAEIKDLLSKVVEGDDFLSLKVVKPTTKNSPAVTLLYRCADKDVSYPAWEKGWFTTKTVRGLKIDLARAAFDVDRSYFNITHSDQPILKLAGGSVEKALRDSAVQISWQTEQYGIALGGGTRNIPGFEQEQMLVDFSWKKPSLLRFRGYWTGSSRGGFILSLSVPVPGPIPLDSTGMALCGVGFEYGERFAPWIATDKTKYPDDSIADMKKSSAIEYVRWAQTKGLEKWLPVDQDLRIFGLSADIGDVATRGNVLGIFDAGVTYLSYGPTILWGGNLKLVCGVAGDFGGAIDIPSKTLALAKSIDFKVQNESVGQLLDIHGSVELSASLGDPARTWVALGGYDMSGCVVKILPHKQPGGGFKSPVELSGGLRLIPSQGISVRAKGSVEGSATLWIEFTYSYVLEMTGRIDWNPTQLYGQLDIRGVIRVKVIGLTFGFGLTVSLVIQILKPLMLSLSGELFIELPWPLGTSKTEYTIFKYEDKKVTPPQPALAVKAGEHLQYFHAASGTTDQLKDQEWPEVWPDISFDIPFRSVAASTPPMIVNRADGDGHLQEPGMLITHSFSMLKITKYDPGTKVETELANISAAWLSIGGVRRTSRLAIPCNEPLSWLQMFEYATPGSAESNHRAIFQSFGDGPDQVFTVSNTTGWAVFDLSELRISSDREFHLAHLHWIHPYARAVLGPILVLEVAAREGAKRVPLPIAMYDVRLVARDLTEGMLYVEIGKEMGKLSVDKVRPLADGMWEWSVRIALDEIDARKPLTLHLGEGGIPVVAVGFAVDAHAGTNPGTKTVFQPGFYKLYIDGVSRTTGDEDSRDAPWVRIQQPFKVMPPPLRPYLRFATIGDERIFGMAYGGWNPNPSGVGFGHYQHHRGVIRTSVDYLSKIYPRIWISTSSRDDYAFGIDVKQCKDGGFGKAKATDELVQFDVPKVPGSYVIRAFRSKDGSNSDKIKISDLAQIDEWSYRVSQYALPQDHLKPKTNAFSRAYGPFGVRNLSIPPAPDVPAGTNYDAMPEARLLPRWALPARLRREPDITTQDVGLSFFHLLEWSGVFGSDPQAAEERVFARPATPDLNLIVDASGTPAAFLHRTAEPCDWRRVNVTVLHGTNIQFERRFATRLVPSPDGCAALILLLAENVPVRVPRGQYALRFRYQYRVDGLAGLVDGADANAVLNELQIASTQPMGGAWNV